ncbi:hypothetical protein [Bradyrhizobium sp. McL0616]|uniref:hypothetical protein n=1 Tax=Bradyrhizobium sp. McL0616 TaxID=3415674 RepID=UPI003CFA68E8
MLGATPNVLNLTPLKDARHHLHRYLENLEAVEHPRTIPVHRAGGKQQPTLAALEGLFPRLEARCRRVTVSSGGTSIFAFRPAYPRWATAFQRVRRSVLARSRNQLLFGSLRDEDRVLTLPPGPQAGLTVITRR